MNREEPLQLKTPPTLPVSQTQLFKLLLITAATNTTVASTTTTRPTITTNILPLLPTHQNQTNVVITNINRRAIFNFKCMQCGEGAHEANCNGGGCGYVVSIGNDGGGGKEKNHKQPLLTPPPLPTPQIPPPSIQIKSKSS